MTANNTNETDRRFGRRSVLLGAGGLVLGAGGIAGGASVFADEREKNEKGPRDETDGRSPVSPQGLLSEFRTEAFLVDVDGDEAFTSTMELSGEPSADAIESSVHVSSCDETSDYAGACIDLRAESPALGEVSDPGTLTYDYYKGADTTHRVPDEVFLAVQTGATSFAGAYRGADADQPETWETRDVSSELTADGWQAIEIDITDLDFTAIQQQLAAADSDIDGSVAVLEQVSVTERIESVSNLVSRFGEDATILSMALGVGDRGGAVTDAYYDNLRIHDETVPIPAVLSMDPTFAGPQGRGGGRFTASLSFATDGHGLTAEDIDVETVELAPYSPVAPPLPGTSQGGATVAADGVGTVSADSIEVEFVPGQVQQLQAGNQPTTVIVSGDFDVPGPYTFVAVGRLEGAGHGN